MNRENSEQRHIASVGGTFDTLHPGHKEYLLLAFEFADRVMIYVSSDEYCKNKKQYEVRQYATRVQELKDFLVEHNLQNRCEIRCLYHQDVLIVDYLSNPDLGEKIDMAIIGPEYCDFFRELNCKRKELGMRNFLILIKERVYYKNDSTKDISSFKIRKHAEAASYKYEMMKDIDI